MFGAEARRAEPVNDIGYFITLLRYIHQNPVKAGIVERVKDFEYSSWGEYEGSVEPVFQICDVKTVLNRIPFRDLEEWVNDPLDDDVQCLEIEKPVFSKPSDDQVWMLIKELVGVTNSTAFQQLADETKRNILKQLKDSASRVQNETRFSYAKVQPVLAKSKDSGASHRQLERLTGVGRGLIQKL